MTMSRPGQIREVADLAAPRDRGRCQAMAHALRNRMVKGVASIEFLRPGKRTATIRCPVEATHAVVAGKWKLVILWHLRPGALRFGELRNAIPGATQNILTAQLRGLESDGLVSRKEYAQVPRKVEYTLTALGHTLEPLVDEMCRWGEMYVASRRRAVRVRKSVGDRRRRPSQGSRPLKPRKA